MSSKNKFINFLLKKPAYYQFTLQDLNEHGISLEFSEELRVAVNNANKQIYNTFWFAMGNFFKPVTNILDTLFKIFLFVSSFFLFIQGTNIHKQADIELQQIIVQAEATIADIAITQDKNKNPVTEILENLKIIKKEKIKPVKYTDKQKKEAQKWLKYRNSNLEKIWGDLLKDPGKISDLAYLYKIALNKYSDFLFFFQNLPTDLLIYWNAFLGSIAVLFSWILLQIFSQNWASKSMRAAILHTHINRVQIP